MFSCRSVEKAISLSSINGEWNIIEVNGSKITPGESKSLPFIAFDTATGRVSGNSGCNRMMGSFDVNAKPGSLELTGMASTRMMCPDMTTENNVLNAFAQVKGYKKAGKDKMYLCNSSNRPVVVLQKKEADVKLSVLNGEWKIKLPPLTPPYTGGGCAAADRGWEIAARLPLISCLLYTSDAADE